MTTGEFVWAELSASDRARTETFYSRLLGWRFVGGSGPHAAPYRVAQIGGLPVAGVIAIPKNLKAMGMPCFWMSYIQTPSAAESVAKARTLGGSVEFGPMDAYPGAQIALIRDPLGAGFTVISGDGLSPRAETPRPGEIAWNTLYVSDVGAVAPFYEALFGWRVAQRPGSPDLFSVSAAGRPVASFIQAEEGSRGAAQYWGVHFAVANLSTARSVILEEGGAILRDEPGLFCAKDPDGATFFLLEV